MVCEKSVDVEFIRGMVNDVVKEFPLKVEQYQNGKVGIVNMLMGEIKRRSHDKFDVYTANIVNKETKRSHQALRFYKKLRID